jgi:LmbE family N-acetylglucosaminyl deacetylase
VDVLFIHAHPDDEALDYGALLLLSEAAGLSTAVLLITDGEGGIFQEDYTGPRTAMGEIRVREASASLGFLGSSLYLRLGWKNHPYNGIADQKTAEDVLAVWGGDNAAARLADIIQALGPRVVVSPDGPSAAREHFEHEAAGLLALKALNLLRDRGVSYPPGHLHPIDPRQSYVYPARIGFPRASVLATQRKALSAHRTQADASYFGVSMIRAYDREYYGVVRWALQPSPEAFFMP